MAGLLTLVFGITVALQVMMTDGGPSAIFQGATNTNHLHNKVKGTWKCDDENKNSVCEDHCFTKENHRFDCKFTVKRRLASGSHQRAAPAQERQMVEEYDVVSERRRNRNKSKNKKEKARQQKNNGKEPTDGLEPADEDEEPNPHKHAPAAAAANNENHQPVKAEGLCHCVFH